MNSFSISRVLCVCVCVCVFVCTEAKEALAVDVSVPLEDECPEQLNDDSFISVSGAVSNRKSFIVTSVVVPFFFCLVHKAFGISIYHMKNIWSIMNQ